jgi:hypothetical protein
LNVDFFFFADFLEDIIDFVADDDDDVDADDDDDDVDDDIFRDRERRLCAGAPGPVLPAELSLDDVDLAFVSFVAFLSINSCLLTLRCNLS